MSFDMCPQSSLQREMELGTIGYAVNMALWLLVLSAVILDRLVPYQMGCTLNPFSVGTDFIRHSDV